MSASVHTMPQAVPQTQFPDPSPLLAPTVGQKPRILDKCTVSALGRDYSRFGVQTHEWGVRQIKTPQKPRTAQGQL
jgi:hypothetical protein